MPSRAPKLGLLILTAAVLVAILVLVIQQSGGTKSIPGSPTVTPLETDDTRGNLFTQLQTTSPWDPAILPRLRDAAEAGTLPEIHTQFAAYVATSPDDADAVATEGTLLAMLIPLETSKTRQFSLGFQAHTKFERAKDLEPGHWGARMGRVGLYMQSEKEEHWRDAIEILESLEEDQASRPADPKFARTFLFLGQLYDRVGRTEDARAAWSRGRAAFPADADLAETG